jgi:regulator of sigma E protease
VSGSIAITVFVISIVVSIMLHELGHLLTAKRFGMRADRYFVGFGPTLWSTHRGETEYGVKAFPLGGFVRIVGMSPLDERLPPVVDEVFDPGSLAEDRRVAAERADHDDPLAVDNLPEPTWQRLDAVLAERGAPDELRERIVRRTRANLPANPTAADARHSLHEVLTGEVTDSGRVGDLHHRLFQGDRGRFFHDRPAWQRAIVLVAGSLTHFLIAILVLAGAYAFVPQLTGEVVPVIDAVLEGSPAEEAGLRPGDRVVAVGEVRSGDYEQLRQVIVERPGEPTPITVERDGEELVLTVTPAEERDADGEPFGRAGFVPTLEQVRLGPVAAVEQALVGEPSALSPGGFVPMFTGSLEALLRVFSPDGLSNLFSQATGQTERGVDGAISLVGAASIAGQAGSDALGLTLFFALLAAINVFIGIFNLVPLPPLDGGHLAVLAIERSINAVRSWRGRSADYVVDPRAVAAVAFPVIVILGMVFIALLWLDITDPIRLG